jgi:membrane protease YdiL (CAAX protease family)
MTVIMNCTACQARVQVPEEWEGQEVECPQCKKTFEAIFPPKPPPGPPGPGVFAAVGWILALLLGQFLIIILANLLLIPALFGFDRGVFPVALATISAAFAACLIVGREIQRDKRRVLALRRLDGAHVGCVLLLSFPLVIIGLTLVNWLNTAYQWMGLSESQLAMPMFERFFEGVQGLPTPLALTFTFVFLAVLPGVYEELYLRGFIGRGLVARLGAFGGILLTSVLFGALHFHPIQSVVTMLLGLILHATYLWSRSLIAPILLHVTYNSLLSLPVAYLFPAVQSIVAGPPPLLILAALASVTAVCWLYYRIRVRWLLPDGVVWTPGYVTAEMPPAELGAQPSRRQAGRWPLLITIAAYSTLLVVLVWHQRL